MIYDRIKQLAKSKGITMTFLCNAIGGYRGKMTDVKNGKVALTDSEICTIASILGVTVDYLLTGEENKKSPAQEGEVKMDELEYALWGEVKDLSDGDKQVLLSMAKQLNGARR